MNAIRHLFWDFDGTLYDSYPQITRAFERALEAIGLAGLATREELLRQLKKSVYHTALWCAQKSGMDVQAIVESNRFFHHQENCFPLYEGVESCLKALKEAGFHHYLYTHRDEVAVEQLRRDGLWTLFDDAVISTDGFPQKPAPDALLALMKRNSLQPGRCAMVGDRDMDIAAGHNAGMKGILFDPDGFYPEYPAELRVTSMRELTQELIRPWKAEAI